MDWSQAIETVQVRGQLWGQVLNINLPYRAKSMRYIAYSVVLAQR